MKRENRLNLLEIEQLAFLGCSVQEIAIYVNRNEAALEKSRRCIWAMSRGRVRFLITLRRRMFELAVGGNTTLLIFLHNNPAPLNALCNKYKELNEQLRFNRMAADREEVQRMFRGWSLAEGTGAAGSDGPQDCTG
jgi:hypothetical protein